MKRKGTRPAAVGKIKPKKRTYLSQTDVPGSSLDSALRVPRAIVEHYAGSPVTPLQLASALNMSPSSGPFRALCGASIAYGLTDGGYNAQQISLTALGKRIVKPLAEADDAAAKREAILTPRVVGEFLRQYNGSSLPRLDIALNVLSEMGVPSERVRDVYDLIIEGAELVGLLREIKDKKYVDLSGVQQKLEDTDEDNSDDLVEDDEGDAEDAEELAEEQQEESNASGQVISRKVFITHGKDKSFIEPIKRLLGFGELIPIVSVDRQSVSKPVPDKVMDDMRSCSAAIIHVDAEETLIDQEARQRRVINPNVLIEIGAAMALYGRRFILLVQDGIELPSNLQGLYEVRYKGESLDGDATIKLLEAINDIKNNPLPDRYRE